MKEYLWVGFVVAIAGCAAGLTGMPNVPFPVGGARPEDRVVLGDFSRVNAVAATLDRVFVVYPTGLGVWRPLERRWEAPRGAPDLMLLSGVTGAVVDPVDQSLWLVSRNNWLHYFPDINQWDRGLLPTDATAIAVETGGVSRGIWFRTRAGWLLLPRGGGLAAPAVPGNALRLPATVDDALRANPAIRAQSSAILTGPRFANGSFTAAAAAVDGRGWFIGTSNRGVVWFDNIAGQPEFLTLGLAGEIVGAIAVTDKGVWVATDRDGSHLPSLAFVAADLSGTQELRGPLALGLPFGAVRAILPDGPFLWLGTDQGVVRLEIASGATQRWVEAHGLPDGRVLALAKVGDKLAVGTMRGLAQIAADGKVARIDPEQAIPIYALHAWGGVLWIGSHNGVFALSATDPLMRRPIGMEFVVPDRQQIFGIGQVGDTIVAITAERVIWREPGGDRWHSGPALSGNLGLLSSFYADNRGIWIGGESGVGVTRPTTSLQRPLTVPGDLPGSVTAIGVNGPWLWVGTQAGLVRFRLSGQ